VAKAGSQCRRPNATGWCARAVRIETVEARVELRVAERVCHARRAQGCGSLARFECGLRIPFSQRILGLEPVLAVLQRCRGRRGVEKQRVQRGHRGCSGWQRVQRE
jgi:hypothetical protein